jgi:hypothetical protein
VGERTGSRVHSMCFPGSATDNGSAASRDTLARREREREEHYNALFGDRNLHQALVGPMAKMMLSTAYASPSRAAITVSQASVQEAKWEEDPGTWYTSLARKRRVQESRRGAARIFHTFAAAYILAVQSVCPTAYEALTRGASGRFTVGSIVVSFGLCTDRAMHLTLALLTWCGHVRATSTLLQYMSVAREVAEAYWAAHDKDVAAQDKQGLLRVTHIPAVFKHAVLPFVMRTKATGAFNVKKPIPLMSNEVAEMCKASKCGAPLLTMCRAVAMLKSLHGGRNPPIAEMLWGAVTFVPTLVFTDGFDPELAGTTVADIAQHTEVAFCFSTPITRDKALNQHGTKVFTANVSGARLQRGDEISLQASIGNVLLTLAILQGVVTREQLEGLQLGCAFKLGGTGTFFSRETGANVQKRIGIQGAGQMCALPDCFVMCLYSSRSPPCHACARRLTAALLLQVRVLSLDRGRHSRQVLVPWRW